MFGLEHNAAEQVHDIGVLLHTLLKVASRCGSESGSVVFPGIYIFERNAFCDHGYHISSIRHCNY